MTLWRSAAIGVNVVIQEDAMPDTSDDAAVRPAPTPKQSTEAKPPTTRPLRSEGFSDTEGGVDSEIPGGADEGDAEF